MPIETLKKTLVALTAAVTFGAAPAAAQAQEGVDSVRPGKNLLLVHNTDFVGAFGYAAGSPVRVEVVRGGHVIGAASAPAAQTVDGPGLEVNHGPLGAAQPGDCWENYTPDVRPGDKIVVTGDGGQDVVYVDDIEITRGAYTPSAEEIDADPSLQATDVVIEGRARHAGGAPIALAALDSAEVRGDAGKTRAVPNVPLVRLGDPAGDRWRAIYRAPGYGIFRGSGDRFSLLAGDHAIGYGHAPVPPLPVAQLVDGVGSGGGPALGCEASPAAPASAVTTLSDQVVNIASGDLTVSGVVAPGVLDVAVTLDDGPAGRDPLVLPVAADRMSPHATGATSGSWSIDVARTQLQSLVDGTVSITAAFDGGAGPNTVTLRKDVVAPAAIVATPAPGTYAERQFVTLGTGDAGDTIRYTRDGTAPTPASLQAGGSISVSNSQTITAQATDAAGNVGAAKELAYSIEPVAPVAPVAPGGAGAAAPTASGALATTAPVGGPAVAAVASAAAPARLLSLVTTARVKRSAAARGGLRLVMRLGARSSVVQIRVYRRSARGRVLISSGLRAPATGGVYRVWLRHKALRGALKVGSYEVQVTPGPSRSELGRASTVRLRVVHG